MKGVFSWLAIVVGAAVLLLVSVIGYHWLTYYSEYNALLREITKHSNLQIIDHWRHEDVTLEDFGFTLRSARIDAAIHIVDGSTIRRVNDPAKGIAFHLRGETYREGNSVAVINRVIEFDSPEWQQRGLPRIRTIAELLTHFDAIAANLLTSPPPAATNERLREFITLAPASSRRHSHAQPQPLSKLKR